MPGSELKLRCVRSPSPKSCPLQARRQQHEDRLAKMHAAHRDERETAVTEVRVALEAKLAEASGKLQHRLVEHGEEKERAAAIMQV
eukprot:SAG11_NODE_285_length_11230_cov_6.339412_4_plen_86_part_00